MKAVVVAVAAAEAKLAGFGAVVRPGFRAFEFPALEAAASL